MTLVEGEGPLAAEDEIPAVLDLLNRIVPLQIDGFPIGFEKLRPDDQSPAIEALADEIGTFSSPRNPQRTADTDANCGTPPFSRVR